MSATSVLAPGGDPWKLVPYALLVSFIGVSGQLVVALQFRDYLWAAMCVTHAVYCPLLILGIAHLACALAGERLGSAWSLALAVVIGCFAAQMLQIEMMRMAMGPEAIAQKGYLHYVGLARGPLLWWGLVAAAWYLARRSEMRAAEVAQAGRLGEELRASTAQARLHALQAQVEPHFLFNTLAHVKWLYQRDRTRGRHMLDRLVDYLQAALPRMRQADTTLAQELELAHAYLDLQQIRIGGRLGFSIEVPEEFARLRFPPLMLLTLVENAIKHGIAPLTEGGTIRISAGPCGERLRIEVRDTGRGFAQAGGSGMGLANVRARLAALFGAGARLVIEPNTPRGVVAAIEIPR